MINQLILNDQFTLFLLFLPYLTYSFSTRPWLSCTFTVAETKFVLFLFKKLVRQIVSHPFKPIFMTEHSFYIYFNFPLENTGKIICMEAIVEPDQSSHYYNIHSFRNFNGIKKSFLLSANLLPDIKIKEKLLADKHWVHIDSEEVSVLSSIVGKAIEQRKLYA